MSRDERKKKMNEKVKQIFEILGLEPEEEFKFRNNDSCLYKFDDKLYLYYLDRYDKDWRRSGIYIADIIKYGIIKIPQKPKLTNKDKVAIKLLKNCGWHYIVKDKDGFLYVYKDKPYKQDDMWAVAGFDYAPLMGEFGENPFDFKISWTDAEPLCLDDFSDEELRED